MTKLREFDQAELERLRRIRECHDADRLTERELGRAVAQFGVRRPASRRRRAARVVWLAAAGLLLALGALAATDVLSVRLFSAEVKQDATSEVARTAPGKKIPRVRPQQPVPREEEIPLPEISAPPEASASAESLRRSAAGVPRNQPALEVVSAEVGSDRGGRAWTRAAEALRRGDPVAAEQALGELSRSDDTATRDAALLAQAELDLGTGNEARARAVLSGLAERGATPFVRQRAQQILSQKK